MKYKSIKFLLVVLIAGMCSKTALGQSSADQNKIRAYYSRAKVALTNSNWDSALENVGEAQKLAGKKVAAFELIRVRAYYGNKQYAKAKQTLEVFYGLSPNQNQISEVAPYSTMIDDGIKAEKARLARKKREAQRRLEAEKERQAEREAYQKKLDAISVRDEAIIAGNKMREDIHTNILGGGTISDITVRFRTVVDHDFFGNPEYGEVVNSDELQIVDPEYVNSTDYNDASITLDYTIKGIRNCNRGDRFNMTRYYVIVYFTPTSSQIKVRYKLNGDIRPNAFGCIHSTREYRKEFTNKVERFVENHINANVQSLNNIGLNENQKLALKKDESAFMEDFIRTVASNSKRKTGKELQKERERNRQIAEQEAERQRLANIEEEKEAKRKASYDIILEEYYSLDQGYNTGDETFSATLKKFEEHIAAYPEDAQGLNLYAYFLTNANQDLDKALSMASKANKITPDKASTLDTIGWIYTRKKDYQQAKKYLEEAVGKSTNVTRDLTLHLITAHYGRYNMQVNTYDGEQAVKYAKYAKTSNWEIPLADRVINFLCPDYRACNESYWIESEYKGKWLVSFMKVSPSQKKYQGLRQASTMSGVEESIKEVGDGGYLINLEYGDDTWVMTFQGGFSGDTKIISNSDLSSLASEIKRYWENSYHMIDIEYALGKWYVVMLNADDYPSDGYSYNDSYEKFTGRVKARSENGYRLTSMEFANGTYFGIYVKEPNNALSWNEFDTQTDLESFLETKIGEDYAIFYGSPTTDTEYFIMADKPNDNSDHKYVYFPKVETIWSDIETYWDQGYRIKNIEYQK